MQRVSVKVKCSLNNPILSFHKKEALSTCQIPVTFSLCGDNPGGKSRAVAPETWAKTPLDNESILRRIPSREVRECFPHCCKFKCQGPSQSITQMREVGECNTLIQQLTLLILVALKNKSCWNVFFFQFTVFSPIYFLYSKNNYICGLLFANGILVLFCFTHTRTHTLHITFLRTLFLKQVCPFMSLLVYLLFSLFH